ncbi:MAG: cell division protein FtsZ [Paludibacteraceae bacterium]|nr:cell division protein FtsZ [Paludibacteraceae bacterium]
MEEISLNIPNAPEAPIIKVIGVGGGGCNAVKNMKEQNIQAIDYMAINTDEAALVYCGIECSLLIGEDGSGTGGDVELGRKLAEEDAEAIREYIGNHVEMVFVTACLGKGTGTGAGPVVAKIAKEMGILTVGVVTLPSRIDGAIVAAKAAEGLEAFKQSVDSLVIIANERITKMYPNLGVVSSKKKADEILTSAVRGISEVITCKGYVNVDMNDVKTTLRNSGDALFGTAVAEGENRAYDAVHAAVQSPLLINNKIRCAKSFLLNISYTDKEPTMDELGLILETLSEETNEGTDAIYGFTKVEGLGEKLGVTIVLTGQDLKKEELDEAPTPQVVVTQPKNPYDRVLENELVKAEQDETSKMMEEMQRKQQELMKQMAELQEMQKKFAGNSGMPSGQPQNAFASQPQASYIQQPVSQPVNATIEMPTQPQPAPLHVTPKKFGENEAVNSTPAFHRFGGEQTKYSQFPKESYSTFTFDGSTNTISNKNKYLTDKPD